MTDKDINSIIEAVMKTGRKQYYHLDQERKSIILHNLSLIKIDVGRLKPKQSLSGKRTIDFTFSIPALSKSDQVGELDKFYAELEEDLKKKVKTRFTLHSQFKEMAIRGQVISYHMYLQMQIPDKYNSSTPATHIHFQEGEGIRISASKVGIFMSALYNGQNRMIERWNNNETYDDITLHSEVQTRQYLTESNNIIESYTLRAISIDMLNFFLKNTIVTFKVTINKLMIMKVANQICIKPVIAILPGTIDALHVVE